MSWQVESGPVPSNLALKWPGEDVKMKPQQGTGNGGEKPPTSLSEARGGRVGEREQRLLNVRT